VSNRARRKGEGGTEAKGRKKEELTNEVGLRERAQARREKRSAYVLES